MNLTSQELAKLRKVALNSVSLNSELKSSVVDAKLRELCATVKQQLTKKGAVIELTVVKGSDN